MKNDRLAFALLCLTATLLPTFGCSRTQPDECQEVLVSIEIKDFPMTINKTARTNLRNMIADCSAFRSWHGNSWKQAEARARIYTGGLPSPADDKPAHTLTELNTYRPFVILWTDEEEGLHLQHEAAAAPGNGAFSFAPSGMLIARFERLVDSADANATGTAEEQMMDEMDAIVRSGDVNNPGLLELAGQPGYLAIESLSVIGPRRAPENDRATAGDWIRMWMEFRWGVYG